MKEGVQWLINVMIAGGTSTNHQEDRRTADHPADSKKGNVVVHEIVNDQDMRSLAIDMNDQIEDTKENDRIVNRPIKKGSIKNDPPVR